MYQIFFKASAIKEIKRLPLSVVKKIKDIVNILKNNPFPIGFKELHGFKNLYRLRINDYRVVYLVEKSIKIITITRIAHRRGVYK